MSGTTAKWIQNIGGSPASAAEACCDSSGKALPRVHADVRGSSLHVEGQRRQLQRFIKADAEYGERVADVLGL